MRGLQPQVVRTVFVCGYESPPYLHYPLAIHRTAPHVISHGVSGPVPGDGARQVIEPRLLGSLGIGGPGSEEIERCVCQCEERGVASGIREGASRGLFAIEHTLEQTLHTLRDSISFSYTSRVGLCDL